MKRVMIACLLSCTMIAMDKKKYFDAARLESSDPRHWSHLTPDKEHTTNSREFEELAKIPTLAKNYRVAKAVKDAADNKNAGLVALNSAASIQLHEESSDSDEQSSE